MHRDFHYFACYLAARAAGIPAKNSMSIAEYGEIIDESFNDNVTDTRDDYHWTPTQYVDHGWIQRTVTTVTTAKMMQRGKNRGAWFNVSWAAFHFLPNLDPPSALEQEGSYAARYWLGDRKRSGKWSRAKYPKRDDWRTTSGRRLSPADLESQMICYPGSNLGNRMIDDARDAVQNPREYIKNTVGEQVLADFEEKIEPLYEGRFTDAMVGVRGHIFVDFWAHQGFCGPRSPRVNDIDTDTFDVKSRGEEWTNFKNHRSFRRDENAKAKLAPASHNGHGNANRLPDLPGFSFRYTRPFDGAEIERSNPREYAHAFQALYSLLSEYADVRFEGRKDIVADHIPSPDNFGERFWEHSFRDFMKTPRNTRLRGMALDAESTRVGEGGVSPRAYVDDRMVAADCDEDFGVINAVRARDKANETHHLAYFSLAALCHICWFEKIMTNHLGKDFNSWCQENLTYKVH